MMLILHDKGPYEDATKNGGFNQLPIEMEIFRKSHGSWSTKSAHHDTPPTSDSTHHTTDDQQRKSRRPLRVVPGAMPTL